MNNFFNTEVNFGGNQPNIPVPEINASMLGQVSKAKGGVIDLDEIVHNSMQRGVQKMQVGGRAIRSGVKKLEELLTKLPAGTEAAQQTVAAEMAAKKAAQEAAYAAHTLPTEKGNKTIANAKKTLNPQDEARLEAEMRAKGKQKLLEGNHPSVPKVVYHGTKRDFSEFKPKYDDNLSFFSTNPEFAGKWPSGSGGVREISPENKAHYEELKKIEEELKQKYMQSHNYDDPDWASKYDAERAKVKADMLAKTGFSSAVEYENKAGIQVMPVNLSVKNPFHPPTHHEEVEELLNSMPNMQGIVDKGLHKSGNWIIYENPEVIKHLKKKGYDAIWLSEDVNGPHETIAPFSPNQIKSAIGNRGTYDIEDPDITKAHGGLIHMAEGGVPEKRDVSQLFPLKWSADANLHKGRTGVWTDTNDVFTGAMSGLFNTLAGGLRGRFIGTAGVPGDIIEGMSDLEGALPAMERKPKGQTFPQTYKAPPAFKLPTMEDLDTMLPSAGDSNEAKIAQELGQFMPFTGEELIPAGRAIASSVKKLAPTAAEMALDLAEKGGMPIRQFVVPPEGKLSKEEYSRMMREKYAAENAERMAKKEAAPVTMADLKPKEEKVPADKLGFYSPAEKAAANLKRNIADGELMLSDLKKFPDVTPDELAMTGLEEWLKGKKTVTKQQVKDYMAKNRLEIEEVKYEQGKGNADEMKFGEGEVIDDHDYISSRADDIAYDWDHIGHESRDEIRARILEKYDPEEAEQLLASGKIDDLVDDEVRDLAYEYADNEYYDNPYRRYRNDMGYEIVGNDDVGYSVTDPRGNPIRMNREPYDVETAEGYAREDAMSRGFIDEGETKYHDYQLPGGENYREILLKTPSKKQRFEEEIRELEHSMENPGNDPRELREMQKELDRLKNEYKYAEENAYEGSHWDEPNVIAHLRLQDRVDSEGNKILYVDEMQSDWHQEGRRTGYKDPERMKQADALRPQKKKLLEEFDSISQQYDDYYNKFKEDNSRLNLGIDEIKKLFRNDPKQLELGNKRTKVSNDITELNKQIQSLTSGVPKGPFSDNWHKLALKRVMKYAADNGYTRVGFSKSQPQVNRWGTDVVAWDKTDIVDPKTAAELGIPPTGWSVTATEQRGGRAGNIALEDEARARGILQENRPTTVTDRNQLYAVVAKIGRGKTEEELQKLTDRIRKQMQEKDAGYVAPREAGMKKFYDEELEAALKKYANQFKGKYGQTTLNVPREGTQTINYIDITPNLKNSTKKGQPYKVGGAVHMAEGGVIDLDDLVAQALSKNVTVNLDDMVHQALTKRFAKGGAAYNAI